MEQPPYCVLPDQPSCTLVANCFTLGLQCATPFAPDCAPMFELLCEGMAAPAGCDTEFCHPNGITAAYRALPRKARSLVSAIRKITHGLKALPARPLKRIDLSNLDKVASPAGDAATQVLVGIVEGIENDASSNFTQCLDDEEQAFKDLEQFVILIEKGFKTINIQDILMALQLLGEAIQPIQDAASDCGLYQLEADIAAIIAELTTPGGWITVLEQEGIKILFHLTDITEDIIGAVNDFKNKNWNPAGQDIGRILGYLL